MYKHGKPIYRFDRRSFFIIVASILIVLGVSFFFLVVKDHNDSLKNNNQPLVSTVKASDVNTPVEETYFSLSLPGKWSLASKDWDARYHAWQWESHDKTSAGRWFRVYQDTIPADYAYNYVLPITVNGLTLELGQMSGNCADFTTTSQTSTNSSGTIAAVSKWQGVGFLCDYGNQNHQVVGTSSAAAINTVTLKGPMGTHKYFFLYQDNNFNPDYGVITAILSSFKVK